MREALVAQREFQPLLGGLQPGLLKRALQRGLVAAQQVVGVGTFDHEPRGHIAFTIDVEAHVDAAKLRRIEADFETRIAGASLACDFDGDRLTGTGCAALTGADCGVVAWVAVACAGVASCVVCAVGSSAGLAEGVRSSGFAPLLVQVSGLSEAASGRTGPGCAGACFA